MIEPLMDSLGMHAFLHSMNEGLTLQDTNKILEATSHGVTRTEETLLEALYKVMKGQTIRLEESDATVSTINPLKFSKGSINAREDYFKRLLELEDLKRDKPWTMTSLVGMEPSELITAAQPAEGLAYRYALRELNSFALLGPDSIYNDSKTGPSGATIAPLNAAGDLDPYVSPTLTPAGMTLRYIEDRVAFLTWKNAASIADVTTLLDPAFVAGERLRYSDLPGSLTVTVSDAMLPPNDDTTKRFVFGGGSADAVVGGSFADRLYGGMGTDVLIGGEGNDYLEGGAGFDVYAYSAETSLLFPNTNDGDDEIRDTDGKGAIRYTFTGSGSTGTSSSLMGGAALQVSSAQWQSPDGRFLYGQQGSDLVVTIDGDAGGSLLIRDFDFGRAANEGYLGIRLTDALPPSPASPVRTFYGDKEDWDSDPSTPGVIDPVDDGFGNNVRADGQDGRPDIAFADRVDVFSGSSADEVERFETAGGNDFVRADGINSVSSTDGGRDIVLAGEGSDIVEAGGNDDWVEGGAGDDILGGNSGNDVLWADSSTVDGVPITLAQAITAARTAAPTAGQGDLLTGDDGSDRLIGASTSDLLLGGEGVDIIVGGGGDDNIYGDATLVSASHGWTATRSVTAPESTIIYELIANGYVLGDTNPESLGAADYIYGGAGADWVFAGAGDDFVDAGDTLGDPSTPDDVVFGEAGDDTLIGGSGADVVHGDSASVDAAGLSGNDYLDGGAGIDLLFGGGGDDILFGGDSGDQLHGNDGNDILVGERGNDLLVGGAGKDTYFFYRGDGVDAIQDAEPGNAADASVLVAGPGISRSNVRFRPGSLTVDFGEGDEVHFEGFNPDDPTAVRVLDTIQFSDGDFMSFEDILAQGFDIDGTSADDEIYGTAATDRILAGDGNDYVVAKAGDDTIDGGFGDDEIRAGEGNDTVTAGDGADFVDGAGGDDAIDAGAGDDTVEGGEGADVISGGEGQDLLLGGAGNDVLQGEVGNDTLDGGTGDDLLTGGEGIDSYVLYGGMGADTITDGKGSEANVLQLGAGIGIENLKTAQVGDSLVVSLRGLEDSVTLTDYYTRAQDWVVRDVAGVEATMDAVINQPDPYAGDYIARLWADTRLGGIAQVFGQAYEIGWTPLDGDTFESFYESAYLSVARETTHSTYTRVDPPNDILAQITTESTSSTVQTFTSFQSPTFHWLLNSFEPGYLESDEAFFQAPLTQLPQTQSSGQALLTLKPDRVLTNLNYQSSGFPGPTSQVSYDTGTETVQALVTTQIVNESYNEFANVTEVDLDTAGWQGDVNEVDGNRVLANILRVEDHYLSVRELRGGPSDNIILANPAGLTFDQVTLIDGGAGNDHIQGEHGFFYGGEGDDTIVGGFGREIIAGGPGSDQLDGGAGSDHYVFIAGETGVDVVTEAANDRYSYYGWFYSSLGIDDWPERLEHGNTWRVDFDGSYGYYETEQEADAAVANQGGFGKQFIAPLSEVPPTVTWGDEQAFAALIDAGVVAEDSVEFGPGVSATDLQFAWSQENVETESTDGIFESVAHAILELSWGTGGAVRLTIPRLDDAIGYGVERFVFADGTELSLAGLLAQAPDPVPDPTPATVNQGTPLSDSLLGTTRNDELRGLEGDDDLQGGPGDDVLDGGGGFDFAAGGAGNDTYIFGIGNGEYEISETQEDGGSGTDSVRFDATVTPQDVSADQDWSDLVLTVGTGGDALLLWEWFDEPGGNVELFQFDDGTVWTAADILSLLPEKGPASEGDDALWGGLGNDVLDGLGGNDEVAGFAGDDTLYGGAGDDYLDGGSGNDLAYAGDGFDYAEAYGPGNDLIDLGADDDYAYMEDQGVIIGGAGDDWMEFSGSGALILYNVGDGNDTLYFEAESFGLSLGGGVSASDLSLVRVGGDVAISVGQNEAITLTGYYRWSGSPPEYPEATLQLFGSAHLYDLGTLLDDYLALEAQDPGLVLQLDGVLPSYEIASSQTDALGGAIAWEYANTGSLAGLTEAQIRSVLSDPSFAVAVQPMTLPSGNSAPVIANAIADQSTNEDAAFGFAVPAGTFSDSDAGDTLTYAATLADGSALPAWLSFDAETQAFTGTPLQADVGAIDVKITATDGGGLSAEDTFTLTVQNVNDAPVVSAADAQLLLNDTILASALFSVFDEDGQQPTQYQLYDDVAGGGHFTVNGVEQNAATAIPVSPADLASTSYVAGASPGVERVWARAYDGEAWSAWKSWNMTSALHIPNAAPEATPTAATQTVLLDQAVAAGALFSVQDADGDPAVEYQFYDSTAGNGYFAVNGAEQGVNVAITVSAADLANTSFIGASSASSDTVWVRATDGQTYGAWKNWTMNSWPHATNAAPVADAPDNAVLRNQSVLAQSLFTVTDADGDAPVQYEFWDNIAGGGYFAVNGVEQTNNPIPVAAADLATVTYMGGADPGVEQVWVRASDGMQWGAWEPWNMTTALHIPNAAPEATPAAATQTVLLGQAVTVSSLFSVSDADGDPAVRYEFYDSTAGNGHFAVNGAEQPINTSIVVAAEDLTNTTFVGGSSTGSDTVWVRATDGQSMGAWVSWTMNSWPHLTNSAPVAQADNATVLTGEAVAAATLFSVSDADGDAPVRYEFYDDVAGGGYWALDGVQQGVATAIAVEALDLANTEYVGGANTGSEQVWVRVNDGMTWGAWESWTMNSWPHLTNDAPVITASNTTVLLGQRADASSLFSVTDADEDVITQYEFWDSTAGNGYFAVSGVEQGVNVAIGVAAAQLADTDFVGSASTGSDSVWVRAHDGMAWSDWKNWSINSWPHITNAVPVVTASSSGILRNEALSAGMFFGVSDADGDATVQFEFWDDVNGGGHWSLDGVQQASGTAIPVTAAQLADLDYVGGANPGTEQVWVRASDGMGWSAWKNWQMATEGGMLRGGDGPDTLNGETGPTVLQGGGGNDTLTDTDGDNLFSGGEGDDTMTGGDADDLFAGGSGNDTINTGAGSNIIAYNAGGGIDTVYAAAGASNTLSFGGGIGYDDLSLSKDGNDLIVSVGPDGQVVFKDWYAGSASVLNLQIVHDASDEFDANSTDPLYNKKVQTFDFAGLVAEFDEALAQSPGLTSWAVTNALLQFHLTGSDDAALGGDLAYWYGKNNGFAGISLQAAQQVLGAPGFGSDAQTLQPFSGLQEGYVKLT